MGIKFRIVETETNLSLKGGGKWEDRKNETKSRKKGNAEGGPRTTKIHWIEKKIKKKRTSLFRMSNLQSLPRYS